MSDPNAPAGGDAPAPEGRRCGRCGAVNTRADAVICSNCGALLAAYDAPVGIDTDARPTPTPSQATPVVESEPADSDPAEAQPDEEATSTEPASSPPTDQPTNGPSLEEEPPRTSRTAPTTPTLPARPSLPSRPSIEPVPTIARPVASPGAPASTTPSSSSSQPAAPTAIPPTQPPAQPTQPTPPQPPRPTSPVTSPQPRRPVAPPPQETYPDEPPDDTPSFVELQEAAAMERVQAQPVTPGRWPPNVDTGPNGPGGFLARQIGQTWIIAGIGGLITVCVLSMIISAAGQETAAGFFIICVGPISLLVLGIGVALVVTRGRKIW